MSSDSDSDQDYNSNKKRTRTIRACDVCRKRKARCSGELPCSSCQNFGLNCSYADVTKRSFKKPVVLPAAFSSMQNDTKMNALEKVVRQLCNIHQLNFDSLLQDDTLQSSQLLHTEKHSHTQLISRPNIKFVSSPGRTSLTTKGTTSLSANNNVITSKNEKNTLSQDKKVLRSMSDSNAVMSPSSFSATFATPILEERFDEYNSATTTPSVLSRNLSIYSSHQQHLPQRLSSTFEFLKRKYSDSGGIPFSHSEEHLITKTLLNLQYPTYYENHNSSLKPSPVSMISEQLEVDAQDFGWNLQEFETFPCSNELILILLEVYFTKVDEYFPMIGRELIYEQLASDCKDSSFLMVLYAILALSLQLKIADTSSISINSDTATVKDENHSPLDVVHNLEVLQKQCLKRAKILYQLFQDRPHLAAVQCLILFSLAGLFNKSLGNPWHYIGTAVRICQEMGYHKVKTPPPEANVHSSFPTLESDLKCRIWFCVYILERYLSFMTGRPCSIHDSEWNTEWPLVTDYKISNLIRHVRLAGIMGRICSVSSCIFPQDLVVFVRETTDTLESWYRDLPQSFLDKSIEFWCMECFMLMMYHTVHLQLNGLLEKDAKSKVICMASDLILKSFELFENQMSLSKNHSRWSILMLPFVCYCLSSSASVWLIELQNNPNQPEVMAKLEYCFKFLNQFKSHVEELCQGSINAMMEFMESSGLSRVLNVIPDPSNLAVT